MLPLELQKRRTNFMGMIGENSIAIIPNHIEQTRNNDVKFPFRSNSDFYYLTGFDEPGAIAVFIPSSHNPYILFCEEKDPNKELWNGNIIGLVDAVDKFNADNAYPITDIEDILPSFLENKSRIIYNLGSHELIDSKLNNWLNTIKQQARYGVSAPKETTSWDNFLHEMRLFKSKLEIKKMKLAAKATTKAHIRAMQNCRPQMMEYELEAELSYEFNKAGSNLSAYPSIVAGGDNACTLHYVNNNQVLQDGDLVLIDAGSEFDCYAADVTRTFPVNGIFTNAQKDIYQIVLDAQIAAIEQVRPGNHWNDIHDVAVRVISQGLIDLGILSGTLGNVIIGEQYKQFFMHRTGHWLGMDVHDVGDYKVSGSRWRVLEVNMVLTVEPGIYISKNAMVPEQYKGIGVRIEDDVLITKNGCELLTNKIPRTIDDIEKIMQANNR